MKMLFRNCRGQGEEQERTGAEGMLSKPPVRGIRQKMGAALAGAKIRK